VNPLTDLLDMTGPQFLKVYVGIAVFAGIVAAYVRWETYNVDGEPYDGKIHPYEVAFLNGGAAAVVMAAIAALRRNKVLAIKHDRFKLSQKLPTEAHPVDRKIESLFGAADRVSWRDMVRDVTPVAERVGDRLAHEKLVVGSVALIKMRAIMVALIGALVIIGCTKIEIGLKRSKPVSNLVFLTFGTLLTLPFALMSIGTTSRGRELLERLTRENEALRITAKQGKAKLSGLDTALAVALFGGAAVAGYSALQSAMTVGTHAQASLWSSSCGSGTRSSSSSSSCSNWWSSCSSSSSSCSSSSCSSSSCGSSCSSCGGGGCGGCGS
jgi:uncharacterized protein (TIGR04222 family)